MRPETLAVHAGGAPDAQTGALSPPLHLATTFAHGPAGERVAGFEYTREGNPTQERLEEALAAMEGGAAALAFASGMAAVVALLESLPAGSEVLIPRDCYTGVRMLGEEFLPARGVTVRMAEFGDLDALRAALTPATRLLWAETPSNPQLQVADIAALAEIAHAHGALLACDNTFATPALQSRSRSAPTSVMHSTTKYLGGHSDVLGGALVFARADDWHEASRAPPPPHRRGGQSLRRLADAARLSFAARAHGGALRQRAPASRNSSPRTRASRRCTIRDWPRIRTTRSRRSRCATSAACSASECAAAAKRPCAWPARCSCSPTPRRWAAASR